MAADRAYRPDIDGLRAIAILAVVAFHCRLPFVHGGYLGVDIFFVISGFLIARLLLDEQASGGHIDLPGFYARRVRRLVPALGVVLATTLAAGFILLYPTEQAGLGRAGLAAAGFAANIQVWLENAGYFRKASLFLPLLHLWSLSVEEQFYLIGPLGLLVLARASRLGWLRPCLAVVGFASLAAVVLLDDLHPEAVFYLTPARVWEFACGVFLATIGTAGGGPRRTRLGSALAAAGLVILAFVIARGGAKATPDPAILVLAAAGTCGLILGGQWSPAGVVTRAVGAKPLQWLGRLSYSWYLWHWPLLAFAHILRAGERSRTVDCILALVALGLAVATYHLVEQPVRQRRPGPFASSWGAIGAGAVILGLCGALAGGLWVWGQRPVAADSRAAAVRAARPIVLPNPKLCDRADLDDRPGPVRPCLLGDLEARPTIVVWGDSHARHLIPALARIGEREGARILPRTRPSCSPVQRVDGAKPVGACQRFNQEVLASLERLKDTEGVTGVILAAHPSGLSTPDALELVRTLRGLGLKLLLVSDGPEFAHGGPECFLRLDPARCGVSRQAMDRRSAPADAVFDSLAAADSAGVRIWNARDVLCDDAWCPQFRGEVILYADTNHLTLQGSWSLIPSLTAPVRWLAE